MTLRVVQRRIVLLVAIAVSTAPAVRAQSVCDQILPLGIALPAGGFAAGCSNHYVLHPANAGSGSGHYWPLGLPGCATGACAGLTDLALFHCAMASGYSCCLAVSQSLGLLPGILIGPVSQAFDQRVANDTDTRLGICYSDYAGNGARLAWAPVIAPPGNGVSQAPITGFQRIFLVARSSSDLVVEAVDEPTPARAWSWGHLKIRYQ